MSIRIKLVDMFYFCIGLMSKSIGFVERYLEKL